MKKTRFLCWVLLVILFFTGCSEKTYKFKNSIEQIESIEIVSAENRLEFTVIKTLSEAEKTILLKHSKQSNLIAILSEIQCRSAEMR